MIPLPEAEELTIKLRRRETAAKTSPGMGKYYTRFQVVTPNGTTEPLAKWRAMLQMRKALVDEQWGAVQGRARRTRQAGPRRLRQRRSRGLGHLRPGTTQVLDPRLYPFSSSAIP